MRILNNIFSVGNISTGHKMVVICGLKFKFRQKKYNPIAYSPSNIKKLIAYVEQLKFILDSCCDITRCKPAKGTLRRVQNFRAKVLKYLLEIFEEEGIVYWIDGGTLLGAYRHKGFVPWDDDIDIATDRENYEKMVSILPKSFKNTGLSLDYGRNHTGFYMKIFYNGFDITDVFVYDYSNNFCSREDLYEIWENARTDFYIKYPTHDLWAGRINITDLTQKLPEYYKKCGLVLEGQNNKVWLFKGFDAATKNHTCNIFQVDGIFPLQKVKFENFEVWAPNDIHMYLSTVNSGNYGDYMQFPPLSSSHIFLSSEYDSEEFLQTLSKNEKEFEIMLENKKGLCI